MNNIVKKGDLIIFSGKYPDGLSDLFLNLGEYERVSYDIFDIFDTSIMDRFYIIDSNGLFQYVFTLGHLDILVKKGIRNENSLTDFLNILNRRNI